ncbi:alpha/beta hydrolase [Photobacterium phosphoreum]|uniref:Alpha/beta hydrolase n=1 Tax=Photobacterium phosphoreum TaxID=659 RepID=A0A2T3JHP4_PHOPO|nr:gamma-mobile-trio protein GmtX [Photobacterium phosphoreum]PSU22711.1 alpha/beta hydrolase [Photobacterium phosphoreum]PSU41243.1 alpha/beta hydrolase [Photobacterium phosphoreum]PSU48489.1 alpha/beta hydrolase [Photobacterium phosphoreum]
MTNPVNPHIILDELCKNATIRTIEALQILHKVLESQSQSKPLDFSISTVGRLSKAQGGPSTQTIRNRTGKHFQQLIDVWATYSGTTRKKPLSVRQKQLLNNNDTHILDSIDDPVIRAVVGSLIAERNKYRDQLNVMKANSDIVIDKTNKNNTEPNTQKCMPQLTPLEAEAIKAAISYDFMQKMHWKIMPTGQVKDADGKEIYLRGYTHILNKLFFNN